MNAFVYKSPRKEGLYLFIAEKDDFAAVPDTLLQAFSPSPIFVMQLELHPDRKLAQESVTVVMHNLATQQFHVQMPPPSALTAEHLAQAISTKMH